MCFYAYSPNKNISIDFSAESIYLSPFGSSRIIADVLLRNASEEELNSAAFLYPNCFYKAKRKRKGEANFVKYGSFQNTTDEVRDPENRQNITYGLSGYEIQYPIDQPNIVKILKPNPRDLNNPHEFSGEILEGSNNPFTVFPDLTDKALILLREIRFSILRYDFQTPVGPGKKRWLRLVFNPKRAAIYHPSIPKIALLWLMDNLKFTYHIMGPFDVLRIFKERLEIFRHIVSRKLQDKRLRSGKDTKEQLLNQLQAIDELKRKIVEPLDSGSTSFKHLSLHIFSGKLRTLDSIYSNGKIDPNGAMPNYLPESPRLPSTPSWRRRVYDWSCENLSDQNKDMFNLYFAGQPSNRILQIILLVLALWVLFKYMILPILINVFKYARLDRPVQLFVDIEAFVFKKHPSISVTIPILFSVLWPKIVYFYNKVLAPIGRLIKRIKRK